MPPFPFLVKELLSMSVCLVQTQHGTSCSKKLRTTVKGKIQHSEKKDMQINGGKTGKNSGKSNSCPD